MLLMLEQIMDGIDARNKESEVHLLLIESSLAPIEERLEKVRLSRRHLGEVLQEHNLNFSYYTFLAVFDTPTDEPGIHLPSIFDEKYEGIDGILHVKFAIFGNSEWNEMRKVLRSLKYGKEDIRRYVNSRKVGALHGYISESDIDHKNRYDLDFLRDANSFIDRTRRIFTITEMRRSLLMVPGHADSKMNIGRLYVFPKMVSYITGQRHYKLGELPSFDIDCLCATYDFSVMLDTLQVIDWKNQNLELNMNTHGELGFFRDATIPPWVEFKYRK